MQVVTGTVRADFSQLELDPGEGGAVVGPVDLGLADDQGDVLILTVPRQSGRLAVRVEVHGCAATDPAASPVPGPALDPAADAVAEWSARTGTGASVAGWAADSPLAIPVVAGADVRMRWSVLDGQAASDWFRSAAPDAEQPVERYLLQVWPAVAAPARTVVASVPWSQYWAYGPAAAALVRELADVPDPRRLVEVVDRALAAHPETGARIRAGEGASCLGIRRYVQELFRVTYHDGVYDDVRDDHERITALITGRAGLAGPGGAR
jgi:hypothetical protein